MAYLNHCKSTIRDKFFEPVLEFLPTAKNRRNCPEMDDALWLESGVRRCLGIFQSGRDFLQHLADCHGTEVGLSTFFESLKSKRRLRLLDEMVDQSRTRMSCEMPDPFAGFKSLEDFDLLAGDGHFIAAASHDKAKSTNRTSLKTHCTDRQNTTKYATGHLYTLDLRSHAMSHLTVADQIARKKEHEMRSLKRQTIETLRQGAKKGRKVLYVWDRAGIDFRQWLNWKNQSGIYFLSRQKDNMNLEEMGCFDYDTSDVINNGVVANELVGTGQGVSVRRVSYRHPETGLIYHYLTNLPETVPPGLIALLYKSRWDIEKVFDEFKNKLAERKSWASSATAKTQQARLLCLTHNLMTLMEEKISKECGVRNEVEYKRRAQRQAEARKHCPKRVGDEDKQKERRSGGQVNAGQNFQRLTQRTVKFIRWLKNHFDAVCGWEQAIARLSKVYSCT